MGGTCTEAAGYNTLSVVLTAVTSRFMTFFNISMSVGDTPGEGP